MKIRKVLDKKVGEKKYYRYLVVLPKELVENSNLLGKNLKVELKNEKIVIKKE